jgi:hypothetical protein
MCCYCHPPAVVLYSLHFFDWFLGMMWDWVHLVRPLGCLLYQSQVIDECGAVGGMRIGRGNQSTRRKPAPLPLCPPQNPHDLTWDQTRAAAVGSRRLTTWAMARPYSLHYTNNIQTILITCDKHLSLYIYKSNRTTSPRRLQWLCKNINRGTNWWRPQLHVCIDSN